MQINASTDYAVRMLLYLAKLNRTVSSSRLAAALGISARYLLQVGARLRDAGLVSVTHGPASGYTLKRFPDEISLYEIISVMEHPAEMQPRDTAEHPGDFQMLDAAYSYF